MIYPVSDLSCHMDVGGLTHNRKEPDERILGLSKYLDSIFDTMVSRKTNKITTIQRVTSVATLFLNCLNN